MLKMVDGTGIIGVDMICPLGISTPQPPNYDKVELEGAGMLVLPNSLDAPLERLELGGKTEQVQTSGKNLLPDKFSIYAEGKSKTNLKLQIGNYVYSSKTSKNLYILHEDKSNITNGWTATNKFNFKIDKEETIEVRIETENPLEILPMIREETELDSYEPYTGGKPSPSPEYPQEIKNVGKWNEGTQKYEVGVKVTGKNLLNLQKEPDVKGTYQGWKVGNGELLTLGVKDKGNNADIKGFYIGFSNQGSEPNGVVWVVDNGVIKANPLNQRKAYVSIFPANETAVKKLTERLDIQCELGNVATPYQPYKEQTLTLTSDRPITKWDRLVEQGGEIGWLYGTKKYVVTGKENFTYGSENYYTGSRIDMFFEIGDATGNEAIMRDLSFVPSIWHLTDKEGFCINGKQLHIGLYNTRIVVSDDAAKEEKIKAYKEFMAKRYADGNPFEVYYKTTETEFIPLPQSEQNAIRALKTYYPTTVITVDGGELDPDIKVTYRKEI